MKNLLIIAAVALSGLFLSAPKAEAGHPSTSVHRYVSGHSSCGCPIYTQRFVRGYDRYRRPIYGYSALPISHGSSCRARSHRSSHTSLRSPSYYSHHSRISPRVSIQLRSGSSHGFTRSFNRGYTRSRLGSGGSCRVR